MSKISTIIAREYLTRVKKKSFLIMTFLTPVLFVAIILIPVWITNKEDKTENKIAIVDQSSQFQDAFVSTETLTFDFVDANIDSIRSVYKTNNYTAIVVIPQDYQTDSIYIFSEEPITMSLKQTLKIYVESFAERQKLISLNIDPDIIAQAKQNIPIKTYQWSDSGELEQSSSEFNMILGFIGAFIIYIFIFTYGSQLMRGTLEEKKDRIIEIIISSAKPFELMLGKTIGVAMVAFTQFGIWILTILAVMFLGKDSFSAGTEFSTIITSLQNFNSFSWIAYFVFFFISGYLLYGSMFAAIGAAVDNETDTQQFMLPITLPLILALIFAQSIIESPNGDLAVILSMIPFTSPIVMMVRIGFGVPFWQMAASGILLIGTFLLTTYLGSKIYRIGILSYGKKVSYKDLWKWIRYKG